LNENNKLVYKVSFSSYLWLTPVIVHVHLPQPVTPYTGYFIIQHTKALVGQLCHGSVSILWPILHLKLGIIGNWRRIIGSF